jgi:vacuolar-type H+-ATPase subunit H
MDEINAERNKIISAAEEEADRQIEDSKTRASQLKAEARTRIDEAVKMIVDYIMGNR